MFGKKRNTRLGLAVMVTAIVAMFAFSSSASAGVGGKTTLKLDPGAAAALTSLGVSVTPVGPATAGPDGIAFPVTSLGGSLVPLALKINHSGGLTFAAGATSLTLTNYTIQLGKKPKLIASAGAARVPLLDLDLSKAKPSLRGRGLSLGPVKATLTAEAAAALNGTFGVTAFSKGLVLGQATVKLTLW